MEDKINQFICAQTRLAEANIMLANAAAVVRDREILVHEAAARLARDRDVVDELVANARRIAKSVKPEPLDEDPW